MRIKLRTKFTFLLAGVAVIPLLLAMTAVLIQLQQDQYRNTIDIAERISHEASFEISAFLSEQFLVLENIELISPETIEDPALQGVLLDRLLFTNDAVADIAITNAAGREISRKNSINFIHEEDLQDRSHTPEFQSVREQGYYIGPIFFERGRPFIILGKAVSDAQGNFEGAMLASIDARVMQDVVRNIAQTEQEEHAYIVNKQGIIVAHEDISQVLRQSDFSHIQIIQSLKAQDGEMPVSGTYENEHGVTVLGATAHIAVRVGERANETNTTINTPWSVVVEQPTSVALQKVYQHLWFSLGILLATLLFALLLARFMGRRIVSPIEELHMASKQFEKKDFDYRVSLKTNDEIEDLANQFNQMAGSIRGYISELKEEQLILTGERNKLGIILQGIMDAVIAVDETRHVILFNKAAEKLTGIPTKTAIGKPISEIFTLFQETGAEIAPEEYCPLGTKGKEGDSFSAKNIKLMSDYVQKEQTVNIVTGHIKEGSRSHVGCIITIHDVTNEKIVENLKGEFISIVAHQLRTPLSGIKWALKMLMDGDAGKLPKKQKDFMQNIYSSNELMIDLVNNLLNITQIEEKRYVNDLKKDDIFELLETMVRDKQESAKNRRITLKFKSSSKESLPVLMDKDRLAIAFQNILENALRYTPEKGTITVSIEKEAGHILVSVKDTGIGISKEVHKRIFGKFYRAKNAVQMQTEGTGLGLYISKHIIEAHDGEIWFESKEGKGTTFYVMLALAPEEANAKKSGKIKSHPSKKRSTI